MTTTTTMYEARIYTGAMEWQPLGQWPTAREARDHLLRKMAEVLGEQNRLGHTSRSSRWCLGSVANVNNRTGSRERFRLAAINWGDQVIDVAQRDWMGSVGWVEIHDLPEDLAAYQCPDRPAQVADRIRRHTAECAAVLREIADLLDATADQAAEVPKTGGQWLRGRDLTAESRDRLAQVVRSLTVSSSPGYHPPCSPRR